MTLTFNLGNCTCEDVFLAPFVLDRLQDTLNDGFCEGGLLFLLGLLFITDPGVQNGLELRSQSNLLLEDERLGLKFGSFLKELFESSPLSQIKSHGPWRGQRDPR